MKHQKVLISYLNGYIILMNYIMQQKRLNQCKKMLMEKFGIAQEKVRNLKEELDIVMGEKEKTGKDFNDAVINEINIKKEEKIYFPNNEDYKEISKHIETEQEQS